MLATAKNYDVICLQMRNYLPQLETPIKKETTMFLNEVKAILSTGEAIKPHLDKLIPRIFNFRIKALKWLSEDSGIDLLELIDEAYPQIEELKNNPKLAVLAENILFALRCNRKVVNAIYSSGDITGENLTEHFSKAPAITYEQFLGSLAFSIPDERAVQKLADWVNASLYIEFMVLAAIIIHEDGIKVPDKIINEMAYLVADAAQEYIAISTEIGLLKPRSVKHVFGGAVDKQNLKEEKYLADSGLPDFAKNF